MYKKAVEKEKVKLAQKEEVAGLWDYNILTLKGVKQF